MKKKYIKIGHKFDEAGQLTISKPSASTTSSTSSGAGSSISGLGSISGAVSGTLDMVNGAAQLSQIHDTSNEQQEAKTTRDSGNLKGIGTYDDLQNIFENTDLAKTDYNPDDVDLSTSEQLAGFGTAIKGGTTAGSSVGGFFGPIGSLIGGAVGAAAGTIAGGIGRAVGRSKAYKESGRLNALGEQANAQFKRNFENSMTNTAQNNFDNTLLNIAALGGSLHNDDTFNNGLRFITEGGSHEENPLGGVPQGIAADGIPNLVEEGEIIYNDYVFSKRLKMPKQDNEALGLKKNKEYSYAEAAEKIQKESEERPNDPISKRNLDTMMKRLQQSQETLKQKQQESKLKRQLAKLSPEEQIQLLSQIQGAQYAKGGHLFDNGGWENTLNIIENMFKTQPYDRIVIPGNSDFDPNLFEYHVPDGIKNLDPGITITVPNTRKSIHTTNSNTTDNSTTNNENIKLNLPKRDENGVPYMATTYTPSPISPSTPTPKQTNANTKSTNTNTKLKAPNIQLPFYNSDINSSILGLTLPKSDLSYQGYKAPEYIITDSKGRPYGLKARGITPETATKTATNTTTNTKVSGNSVAQILRAAPVIGNSIAALASAFDKPNYKNIERTEDAYRAIPYVTATPLTQRLEYNPIDMNYIVNGMRNAAIGNRRAIIEGALGNSAAASAALASANYGNQVALGNAYMQAMKENDLRKQQVQTFNRDTDKANIANQLQVDLENRDRDVMIADAMYKIGMLRDQELLNTQATKAANYTNALNSMGELGKDILSRQQVGANIDSGTWGVLNEFMKYLANSQKGIASKGGKLFTVKRGGKHA